LEGKVADGHAQQLEQGRQEIDRLRRLLDAAIREAGSDDQRTRCSSSRAPSPSRFTVGWA